MRRELVALALRNERTVAAEIRRALRDHIEKQAA
jgi:hypothetical protein